MFLISLQGNPIFGVSLKRREIFLWDVAMNMSSSPIHSNAQAQWDATLHTAHPTEEDSSWTKNPQGIGKAARSPPLPSLLSFLSVTLLTFGYAIWMVSNEATLSALPNTSFKFISLKSGPKIHSMQTWGTCAVLPRGFSCITGGKSHSNSAAPHIFYDPQRNPPCCAG